jgi:hypothetical protein
LAAVFQKNTLSGVDVPAVAFGFTVGVPAEPVLTVYVAPESRVGVALIVVFSAYIG